MRSQFDRLALINSGSKLLPSGRERLAKLSKNPLRELSNLPPEELVASVADCDGLLVGLDVDVTASLLKAVPALRYIAVLGSSLRRIDLAETASLAVHVDRVLGYCDVETAEFVIGCILIASRRFNSAEGEAVSVDGKQLGVIGMGAVGREVARLGAGVGMNVVYHSPSTRLPHYRFMSKADLLTSSDFISLHTPPHQIVLTKEDLALVRNNAVLINTCVGVVCDPTSFEHWANRACNDVIVDAVAGGSLPSNLSSARVHRYPRAAYKTESSLRRLNDRLVENAEMYLKMTGK